MKPASFKFIAGDDDHTCAITSEGDTYCWGLNWSGQLGDNTTTARLVPTAIDTTNLAAGEKFKYLDVGYGLVCGITSKPQKTNGYK